MQASAITFPDPQTAEVKMPNCRIASALRDFFFENGFSMKTQREDGTLILRVPPVSTGAQLSTPVQDQMEGLFSSFCEQHNIDITT